MKKGLRDQNIQDRYSAVSNRPNLEYCCMFKTDYKYENVQMLLRMQNLKDKYPDLEYAHIHKKQKQEYVIIQT